jgi:hypothetical protein
MDQSTNDTKNRGGRPRTGIGKPIMVRLQPDQLAILDKWISRQADPKPSRPEAIRKLLAQALPTANTTQIRGEFE